MPDAVDHGARRVHLRIVLDSYRTELESLGEEGGREVAIPVVAVVHRGVEPDAAPLPDRDRRGAGDEDAVGQVRTGADLDPCGSVTELGPEIASELDTISHDQCAAVRHVQAESGAEVDVSPKLDRRVRVPEQDPALAKLRHQAWTAPIADEREITEPPQYAPCPGHGGILPGAFRWCASASEGHPVPSATRASFAGATRSVHRKS